MDDTWSSDAKDGGFEVGSNFMSGCINWEWHEMLSEVERKSIQTHLVRYENR
jgi:hypothetical protein